MLRADAMAPGDLAAALVRTTLSLGDANLRARYVEATARQWPLEALAQALDALCGRADSPARETLVAVVDALNGEGMQDVVRRLREYAAGASLLALDRLVRQPFREARRSDRPARPSLRAREGAPSSAHDPGRARPLTLGERKALARRADRQTMQRLLADPHPDVIRRCLAHPRLTEDDAVALAARRPGRADVLAEVARSRWVHRSRVRLSLVLNPATPVEIAARITGLLLRPELEVVARSPNVAGGIRALCLEHLARRPPFDASRRAGSLH